MLKNGSLVPPSISAAEAAAVLKMMARGLSDRGLSLTSTTELGEVVFLTMHVLALNRAIEALDDIATGRIGGRRGIERALDEREAEARGEVGEWVDSRKRLPPIPKPSNNKFVACIALVEGLSCPLVETCPRSEVWENPREYPYWLELPGIPEDAFTSDLLSPDETENCGE